MLTAGPENYPEVLEGLLGRRGLALAHCGSKDTDRVGPRKIFFLLLFFLCFVHLLVFLLLLFFIFYFYLKKFLYIFIFLFLLSFVVVLYFFLVFYFISFFDCFYVHILSSLFLVVCSLCFLINFLFG